MKYLASLVITSLVLIVGDPFHQPRTETPAVALPAAEMQCPPDHKNARATLKRFLHKDTFKEKRIKLGVDGLTFDEVANLKTRTDRQVCEGLSSRFEWPIKHHHRTFYKSKHHYFVVDALLQPPQPPNKDVIHIRSAHSVVTVLDEDLNELGGFLL